MRKGITRTRNISFLRRRIEIRSEAETTKRLLEEGRMSYVSNRDSRMSAEAREARLLELQKNSFNCVLKVTWWYSASIGAYNNQKKYCSIDTYEQWLIKEKVFMMSGICNVCGLPGELCICQRLQKNNNALFVNR